MIPKLSKRSECGPDIAFVMRREVLATLGSLTTKEGYPLLIRSRLVLAELVEPPRGKEE
jgi:hypothetical protein